MFSKGWLKREIASWCKEVYFYILWSVIPTLSIIVLSTFSFVFFPNHWGIFTGISIIVVFLFTAYFAFKRSN
jgi:hypothetical protein